MSMQPTEPEYRIARNINWRELNLAVGRSMEIQQEIGQDKRV